MAKTSASKHKADMSTAVGFVDFQRFALLFDNANQKHFLTHWKQLRWREDANFDALQSCLVSHDLELDLTWMIRYVSLISSL